MFSQIDARGSTRHRVAWIKLLDVSVVRPNSFLMALNCGTGSERCKRMLGPIRIRRYLRTVLAVLFVQAPLAHSALISFDPNPISANTGDSFSLDLIVSGLGDFAPDSLGAFDISVGFDATALSFTGYSLGDLLGDVGAAEALDVSGGGAGGTVNVAEVSLLSALSLDALQPGAFSVATLYFDVMELAPGAVTELSILGGAVLADTSGSSISVTGQDSGSIIGATIPIPGTGSLLLASLFGWLTLKRRQSVWRQVTLTGMHSYKTSYSRE